MVTFLVRATFWFADSHILAVTSDGGERNLALRSLLRRALICSGGLHPHDPFTSQGPTCKYHHIGD